MSAARFPAWSSLNFDQTATGKASTRHRCWKSSAARKGRPIAFILLAYPEPPG
jgi:hypothetical protein